MCFYRTSHLRFMIEWNRTYWVIMVDFLVQIISFELNCINFHLHPVEKCSTDIRLVVLSSCRNIHIVCVYWQNYLISAYCHIPYLVAVELADRFSMICFIYCVFPDIFKSYCASLFDFWIIFFFFKCNWFHHTVWHWSCSWCQWSSGWPTCTPREEDSWGSNEEEPRWWWWRSQWHKLWWGVLYYPLSSWFAFIFCMTYLPIMTYILANIHRYLLGCRSFVPVLNLTRGGEIYTFLCNSNYDDLPFSL